MTSKRLRDASSFLKGSAEGFFQKGVITPQERRNILLKTGAMLGVISPKEMRRLARRHRRQIEKAKP